MWRWYGGGPVAFHKADIKELIKLMTVYTYNSLKV